MIAHQITIGLVTALIATATIASPISAPPSAPLPPGAKILRAPPAAPQKHDPLYAYMFDQHADGRKLTLNGYTTLARVNNFNCNNDVLGCTIGIETMVQLLCGAVGGNPGNGDSWFGHWYIVVQVDGAYSAVSPFQGVIDSFANHPTVVCPNNAPYFPGMYGSQRNSVHVDTGTHVVAVQIQLLIDTVQNTTPIVAFGDWHVDFTEYLP